MPKPYTSPALVEDFLCLPMSFLKERNYLVSHQSQSGTMFWTRREEKIASIGISVTIHQNGGYLELKYNHNDEPINYKVQIISKLSNLGKGRVWYFLCPNTGKLCRKLYGGKYFLHREAYIGVMYQKQIESKKDRLMDKLYGPYFDSEKLYDELYKPYFKKYYKGKPTKRYAKIMEKLNEADKVSARDIERLLLFGM